MGFGICVCVPVYVYVCGGRQRGFNEHIIYKYKHVLISISLHCCVWEQFTDADCCFADVKRRTV